ncbi:MAG TPA: ABC transporter permease [Bacteroidales bacterium]|nr:ABC transporter permease [Bacteroidales bacterium]HQH18970.1 ABC transporter permease [Bacteroidales bacterium]
MLNFIIKRLLYGILVIFGVTTVVFVLFNILPGDPARMMLGQRADINSIEAIKKDLGYDKPIFTQYLNYINDLSPISVHNTLNPESYWYLNPQKYTAKKIFRISSTKHIVAKIPYLRRSYQTKKKVSEILTETFPNTFILATVSIGFAIFIGIFIGIFCALFKNSLFDKFSLLISVIGISLPSFFAAIIIAWLFAFLLGEYTGLNMFGSLYSINDYTGEEYLNLKNLILPAFTLGIRPLAIVVELTRNSLLEVLSQDYIRTAKAKGLRMKKIIMKHALKNSLNPLITAISGWFASLMAGAVFIEYVFNWKGIGMIIVESLEKYDFPVIMGSVLFVSLILVFINIFVDIIYAIIDPRVRIN